MNTHAALIGSIISSGFVVFTCWHLYMGYKYRRMLHEPPKPPLPLEPPHGYGDIFNEDKPHY